MEPSLSTLVFAQEAILCDVMHCLTRRWARAFMCALSQQMCLNKANHQRLLAAAWDVCLVALGTGSSNGTPKLYTLRLGEDADWEERLGDIPPNVSLIVGDGSLVYGLGGNIDSFSFDLSSGVIRMLPLRPAQHGPEAVVAGGRLLVLGGYEAHEQHHATLGTLTHRVSAYCPKSNSWTKLDDMSTARSSNFACATDGTSVYVAGGLGDLGPLQSAEVFDTTSCTWSHLPAMSTKRLRCAGAADGGLFYTLGGQFDATCEVLHSGAGNEGLGVTDSQAEVTHTTQMTTQVLSWRPIVDLPFKDMYSKAAAAEGQIYAGSRSRIARYDPVRKQWSPLHPVPGSCITLSTALVPNPIVARQKDI